MTKEYKNKKFKNFYGAQSKHNKRIIRDSAKEICWGNKDKENKKSTWDSRIQGKTEFSYLEKKTIVGIVQTFKPEITETELF